MVFHCRDVTCCNTVQQVVPMVKDKISIILFIINIYYCYILS